MKLHLIIAFFLFTLLFSCIDEKQETSANHSPAKHSTEVKKAALTSNKTWKLTKVSKINTNIIKGNSKSSILIKKNQKNTISGWAVDKNMKGTVQNVSIVIGEKSFKAILGRQTPFVAKSFKNNSLNKAGFSAVIPPNSLAKGKHIVSVKAKHANGLTTISNQKLVLKVE